MRLAIVAAAISVAAMLLTVAFVSGFQYEISQKMFSFSGHIRVQHFEPDRASIAEESPIEANDTVLRVLKKNPDILRVEPFATKNAIIRGKESIETVLLKGVAPAYDFRSMSSFLKSGRWPSFPDSGYSSEICVSSYTAKQLSLQPEDKVVIYFIQPDGSRRTRPMEVSGIFKTGIEDFDKVVALGDLRLIQRLNNWGPNEIGGYEIYLKDYRRLDTVNTQIFSELPDTWNSRSIRELYPGIFDWLSLQDSTITIVIIIMAIIAVLNLVTCLIILLLERTRMIGVLKAVGSPNGSIQRIFLYQGAVITLAGIGLGNLFGLALYWLQQRYGFITLPEDAYFISRAAVRLDWWQVALVNLGTFLTCFLVLLIPTLFIRKIQPAKAIAFR